MLFANLRNSLTSDLKPLAYSAFGLFLNGQATRSVSSSTKYMLRNPSPSAPREVPRPLVILSAEQWDANSKDGMQDFAAMYAERGYTTLEIDLAPPPPGDQVSKTSETLVEYLTKGNELQSWNSSVRSSNNLYRLGLARAARRYPLSSGHHCTSWGMRDCPIICRIKSCVCSRLD
ncbi:hypothetical protein RSOL_412530 [Rhizoctonia solani AG-3 Rhs1AP]|uniref:Uncharacterized protein n=1 Tax=Rhizoctonia solani AG-3 Rhs1AP TaxID=1086054 RepID=X8JE81_9AGAM|nr:hypothetical protein RSOL_412530 [Rhizoctonia solani AG-3 Rhs1AP]